MTEATEKNRPTRTVVVGADGSDPSRAALLWAAAYARSAGAKLVVVHAWARPQAMWSGYAYVPAMPVTDDVPDDLADTVRSQVSQMLQEAGEDLAAEVRVTEGDPVQVLLDAAASADLLVVGRRGSGGFAAALMGSVSRHVSSHAPIPVVVVPHG